MLATESLLEAFSQLDDPRKARGVRHPFSGIVVLMLLGMLARIREMEVLVRWATVIGTRLKSRLGLIEISRRVRPPSAERLPSAALKSFKQHSINGFGITLPSEARAS